MKGGIQGTCRVSCHFPLSLNLQPIREIVSQRLHGQVYASHLRAEGW